MARKAKRAILPVTVSLEGVAKPESVFVHRIGKRFIGLALVLLGVPLELLHRAFGWAATTVRGWKKRFEESGGVDDAPRSGRSRAWTDEHIQLLKDELRSTKPRAAGRLKAVVAKLVSGGQLPPVKSKTTITSALKRAGMRYLAVVRLTFLTDEQRAARVAFSRAQLSHDRRARGLGPSLWKAGAFSDSSYFQSQAHAQRAAARRHSSRANSAGCGVIGPSRLRIAGCAAPGQGDRHRGQNDLGWTHRGSDHERFSFVAINAHPASKVRSAGRWWQSQDRPNGRRPLLALTGIPS